MIEIFEKAALAAGRAILEIYQGESNVRSKPDRSPATEADTRAATPLSPPNAAHRLDTPSLQ